ncbi:MAG TPA: aldehyde dehydrogenase family protein [Candidatus Thermoplasmatota archaeon]|nr:aldehyde dehydrogenase family protein [Candidatus Thermoplasmatota archaeon]
MLDVHNPATGERIARIDADTRNDVARKARATRAAQPSWQEIGLAARSEILRTLGQQLRGRKEDLARTLTTEVGKPITQSRRELDGTLTRLDHFLADSAAAAAESVVYEDGSMKELVEREPLGVIANISAWNYPYFVGSNVFLPALLMGNAVLYKPSEYATLTGLAIAEMMHAAGVPPDVFAPVVGGGDVGASLLAEDIDAVFFTGSNATGRRIAAAAGERMIRAQLELGGKDPAYVADDVDVGAAAASLADGAFYNAGQSCCSVERIYVHERIHDAFVDAFLAEVKTFQVGDPMDERTYIGPLARRQQLDVLDAQVSDAKAKGARLRCDGARIDGPGWYYAPTVLTDVDHTMLAMREESFGPIIGIQRVRDDAEALRLMNDNEFGLTAAVYSRDEARAAAILRRARAGSAYWNCCDRVSPRLPWSGRGASGYGATLGRDGILAMTQPKAWHLRSGP